MPFGQSHDNVKYVAEQLEELAAFLEKCTGHPIDEDSVKERLCISRRTLENISRFQSLRKDRCIPTDLVTPLYEGKTNNILLGTKEEE